MEIGCSFADGTGHHGGDTGLHAAHAQGLVTLSFPFCPFSFAFDGWSSRQFALGASGSIRACSQGSI